MRWKLGSRVSEVEPVVLRDAVENQHGGRATFVQAVPVREEFQGAPIWEGVVHVFDLDGHSGATRVYAWSHAIDGGLRRRFYAVLHAGPVKSPVDAVRAAIVADHKTKNGG